MSFESLGLSADLLRALVDQGYTKPTPIQEQAIPVILNGQDVLAAAQTGTGKTAGFTLPMLQRLLTTDTRGSKPNQPRALILVPTRELAAQVAESVERYGQHLDMASAVIFGGVKINPQIAQLRKGVDILIATPGRLLDHVQQKTLDLSAIEILVLDEADRMLDMGFIHDIRKVLALLPKPRQTLLFSATFSREIRALADKLLDSPVSIDVAPKNSAAEKVEQVVHPVDKGRKRELLSHLIGANNWRQVLVFTRTKHGANRLAKQLESDGLSAAAIHGNKTQAARTRALAGFKDGSVRILVATDIAARGLDIDQLPHVVNFELPNVSEDYVHRIGRTGRAGREGEAMSLVCVDEIKLLRDIERLLGREIRSEVLPGYEPDPSIKAEPIQNGRDKGSRGGRSSSGRNPGQQRSGTARSASRSPRRKPPRDESQGRRAESAEGNGARGRPTGSRNATSDTTGNRTRSGGRNATAEGAGNRARSSGRNVAAEDAGNRARNSKRRPSDDNAGNRARGNARHSASDDIGNRVRSNNRPEVDDNFGNRRGAGGEANGNVVRERREADGNRRPAGGEKQGKRQPRSGNGQNNKAGGRSQQRTAGSRRDKPALLGG